MSPDDIIIWNGLRWEIRGIYLGPVNGQSVVGIRPLGRKLPSAHGQEIPEMFVPEEMLRAFILDNREAGCYRVVPV